MRFQEKDGPGQGWGLVGKRWKEQGLSGAQLMAGVWRVNRNYVGLHQGPVIYGPQVKSSPLPVFENKMLSEHGHTH